MSTSCTATTLETNVNDDEVVTSNDIKNEDLIQLEDLKCESDPVSYIDVLMFNIMIVTEIKLNISFKSRLLVNNK